MTDYGLQLTGGSDYVWAADNQAYNFALSDFTVECLITTTTGGTAISRYNTSSRGPLTGGWTLFVQSNGVIQMVMSDGTNVVDLSSQPTAACDGSCHHIAVTRSSGAISLFFDGWAIPVTRQAGAPASVNVSAGPGTPFRFGGTSDTTHEFPELVGVIEDVALWNRALTQPEIIPTMFSLVDTSDTSLVGYWPLDNSFDDASSERNNGQSTTPISFVPLFHCVWAHVPDTDFAYLTIENAGVNERKDDQALSLLESEPIVQTETLEVDAATSWLVIAILDNKDSDTFPTGAHLSVTMPNGASITEASNSDAFFVQLQGTSIWRLLAKQPMPGTWTFKVSAPQDVSFTIATHTIPPDDVVGAFSRALSPIYQAGDPPISDAVDLRTIGQVGCTALAGVAGAIAVGVGALPACLIALTGLGLGQVLFVIDQLRNMPTVSARSDRLAKEAGFVTPSIVDLGVNFQGGYIQCPYTPAYDLIGSDYTCEVWVKAQKPGPLIWHQGFGLMIARADGTIFLGQTTEFSTIELHSEPTPIFDGEWHHVAGVCESDSLTIYFDGRPLTDVSGHGVSNPGVHNNDSPLHIGGEMDKILPPFQGMMAEARLWNIARSSQNIHDEMDLCVPHDSPGLIGYWPFVNGSASDISPTNNAGVANGSVSYASKPGQALAEVQLGRNAAHNYEYVGEHTFLAVMLPSSQLPYPNNVQLFFDCAGGHGDEAGHVVPVTMGSIVVRGRPNDLILMATGSHTIDPGKTVYGNGSEFGQGTAGIDATGTINRNGFCHQITNRLLYACTWPGNNVTLGQAAPYQVRGYWITVMWTGVYGASWGSVQRQTFAERCASLGFPAPPDEDAALYRDLGALAPAQRRAFVVQASELQSKVGPDLTSDAAAELQARAVANLAQTLPADLLLAMDIR